MRRWIGKHLAHHPDDLPVLKKSGLSFLLPQIKKTKQNKKLDVDPIITSPDGIIGLKNSFLCIF